MEESRIREIMQDNIQCHVEFLEKDFEIYQVAEAIIDSYKSGGKLLICGNGGSAADSQHIVAELVNSFYNKNRPPLAAIALTTDSSIITSYANDFGYAGSFSRQVQAHGKKGDVILGISTSGKSENVVDAFHKAKEKGMVTTSLTGRDGGDLLGLSDYNINVPSDDTARIQECHTLAYHIICQAIEEEMFE